MSKKNNIKKVFICLFIILFSCFLYGDIQDDITDGTLKSTYQIDSNKKVSSSLLRALFLKLSEGAWSKNPSNNIYFNKGFVGIGTNNPMTSLDIYGHLRLYDGGNSAVINFPDSGISPKLYIRSMDMNNLSTFNTRLVIDGTNGNIGIGTENPDQKLHVYSNENSWLKLYTTSEVHFAGIILQDTNQEWAIYKNTYDDAYIIKNATQETYPFYIEKDATSHLIHMKGNNVGIGNPTPLYRLDVSGNLNVNGNITYTGTLTNTSDLQFKKNIAPISNALDKVLALEGISFDWKTEDFQDRNFPLTRSIGFAAQQVEKIVPELVVTGKNGYKSVAYANLTALIVEALKEYKQRNDLKIDALEKRVEKLEEMNLKLLKKLEFYEHNSKPIYPINIDK